jgi:chromosome partitioning protein
MKELSNLLSFQEENIRFREYKYSPPALYEQTVMPLSTYSEAGSHAVVMFDGTMFAYYAIPKFLEIIEGAKERYNPDL